VSAYQNDTRAMITAVDRQLRGHKQPALVLNKNSTDPDNRFLQMYEIANLKLNADLVVLSACKSGQGKLHQGEGVTGLARAFLCAGSREVEIQFAFSVAASQFESESSLISRNSHGVPLINPQNRRGFSRIFTLLLDWHAHCFSFPTILTIPCQAK
jgi:hypothetical protein